MKITAISALVLVGRIASADPSTGIVADRMRPGLGPATLGSVEGAETTPFGQVGLLIALGYVRDPIVLRTQGGAILSRPVRGQLDGTLGWEIGLPRGFAFRVSLPVTMWNDGDRLRGTGVDDSPLRSAAGDLQVGAKVAFVGRATEPGLHAALAIDVTVPMGGQAEFAATDGPTIAPRLLVDWRLPWLTLALDASARFSPTRSLFDSTFSDELDLAGGVIAKLVAIDRWRLFAYVEGAGVIATGTGTRPGELRGALRVAREGRVELDVGAGGGLVEAVGSPRYRVFVLARIPLHARSAW